MPSPTKIATWERLSKLRRQRRLQTFSTLGLVVLGPVLTLVTFLILGPLDEGVNGLNLRLILLADLIYILVVAALVMQRVARMVSARRAKSAGSRLHLRLTGVFAFVALVPTVLVAIFAALTVNFGLEGWFSDRVSRVVGSSLAAAEAYEHEHRRDLEADAEALAGFLNAAHRANFTLPDAEIRQVLSQGQALVQRGLREAFVIDGTADIRARGDRSYLFDFEAPDAGLIERAIAGETVIIQDWDNNEFRALISLTDFPNRLLYISREVDGEILNLLDDTQETANLYNQLESDRGRLLFEFGLLYLGFAVILILAAIWLGLWFAERLSRPVGRLAGAAQQVGAGDLDIQVIEDSGDDEIAMLGRLFNQMTRQLRLQRESLLESNRQTERRRRLFDSVLASVTAGVIGLDRSGEVTFVNRAAARLLGVEEEHPTSDIAVLVPEFAALFEKLSKSGGELAQEEIRVTRAGNTGNLLVRIATRLNTEGRGEGYVIAFDDVTDLVSAQRMAAWGDVARRIAHEIKNPLTPIQLSAERLKRKFSPMVGDAREQLEQYTDVIIRQTGDLRRIVDEFSKFARMPEPERRDHDIVKLVRDAVILQDTGQEDVKISADLPDERILARIDATMISQALTNLIKNAGEATETYREKHPDVAGYLPEVKVVMTTSDLDVVLLISDNGIGLPDDRSTLFEPYVTTRASGTGLGLPIVRKIIEEHGGTLALEDAVSFDGCAHRGASVRVRLPNILDTGGQSAGSTKTQVIMNKEN